MTVLTTNTTTFQDGSVAVNNDDLIIKLKKQIDLLTNKLANLIDQENKLLENDTLTDSDINNKMDEIEKSKILFTRKLNNANKNLNELLKIYVSNSKEEYNNKINYLTKNNNENNQQDILNNNNEDKVTNDNNYQNVVLLSNKDDSGKYYTCYNCRGEKIQFYWESESAKIEYTLRNLDDFPVWSYYIKDFLQKWNFDNILERNCPIDKAENTILKNVIKNSIDGTFNNYRNLEGSAAEHYNFIKKRFMSRYPRDVKDKMWKKILVDEFCSNTDDYERKINNLIQIETWSYDPKDSNLINDRFLVSKIKQTINIDLENKMSNYLTQNCLSLGPDIQPKIFLMYIVDTITYYKHKKGYYDNKFFQCEYCECEFHHPRNCPRKKRNKLRQEYDNKDDLTRNIE